MFVGEAPGKMEVKYDYPFYHQAPAGKEFDRYLSHVDIKRADCYITNYCKRYVENPTYEDFKPYQNYLTREIRKCNPEFIVPLGRWATQFLLGNDVTMDECHGLAHWIELDWKGWVIPCYHPAAGIHQINLQILIAHDIHHIAEALKGNILKKKKDHGIRLYYDADWFKEHTGQNIYWSLHAHIENSKTGELAVDTEGSVDEPYCLSYSHGGGIGVVLMPGDDLRASVRTRLNKVPMILHNALHDIKVLKSMGIKVEKFTDTMVMAHLLGTEPQGLKQLAKRLCGMEMSSYSDLLAEQNEHLIYQFISKVGTTKWPLPPRIPRIDKNGKPGYTQPRGLNTLIVRALKDHAASPIDLRKRWNGWPLGTRTLALLQYGHPPEAELKDLPQKTVIDYAARDADATMRIAPILRERITGLKLDAVLENDLGAMLMIADMMDNGIQVDEKYLAGLEDDLKAQKLVQEVIIHSTSAINIGSADQVADLLFKKLKLTPGKMTPSKKRYTVDDATLQGISHEHPVVQHILAWRGVEKLLNTYVTKLPGFIKNGRIYPKFRITGTPSGRLTCSEPNLMAIPIRSKMGAKIRAGFVAPEGRILASWDLSQIEPRVMAHESKDANLMDVFNEGRDLYTATASKIFKMDMKQVTPEQRSHSKTVSLGIFYDISATGLLRQMQAKGQQTWILEDAQRMIDEWFEVYPSVYDYMRAQRDHARIDGFVRSPLGRIRYLPGASSSIEKVKNEAERQAINHPIQTGAAEIMKSIMARVTRNNIASLPILQIHDELVFELDKDDLNGLDLLMRDSIKAINPLCVPITCGMNFGKTWADLK